MWAGVKAPAVGLRELNRWTLARQFLLERARLDPVTAIERLAGLQAQWPPSPYVALWSRLRGFEIADLEAALLESRVVKAPLMRITLHLVSAREFPLYWAATGGLRRTGWAEAVEAAGPRLEVVRQALLARVAMGPLSRTEAIRVIDETAPGLQDLAKLQLWSLIKSEHFINSPQRALFRTALRADHVVAPERHNVSAEQAATHVVRAHLSAFGPASRADTASWSGQTVSALAAGYEALRGELVEFTGPDGTRLLDLEDGPRPLAETSAPVRFLAKWDSLLLGHARRQRVISEEHRKVVIRRNGDVTPTFTVDGFLAGTWGLTEKRAQACLSLIPLVGLDRGDRAAIEQEGEALVRFAAPEARSHAVEWVES